MATQHSYEERRMVRYVFVLSRRDPDLYSYLKERFADDMAVEVIMDRRHAALTAKVPSSLAGDRRRHPDADAELATRSYTIVTIPDAGGDHEAMRRRRRLSKLQARASA
jgi:hypothetical protein